MLQQYKIWIAECYSCQIDIIELLNNSNLSDQLIVYTSHSRNRPELVNLEHYFEQPKISESAPWLLQKCIENNINILFAGKHSQYLESLRPEFEAHQITLITGAVNHDFHDLINNKYQFTLKCEAQNLPAIPARLANSTESLQIAIDELQQQHTELCVKPVYGVYGAGFLRLQNHVNYFKTFESAFKCNTQQFIEAYSQQEKPIKYLVMPYLAGRECSVDIACSNGKIIAQVTRIKHDYFQECYLEHPCHQTCIELVALFQCDGLINIQFKQDQDLNWHILEINPRPAGGFAYSKHTGVNLVAELFAEKLNLQLQRNEPQSPVKAFPLSYSVKMDL